MLHVDYYSKRVYDVHYHPHLLSMCENFTEHTLKYCLKGPLNPKQPTNNLDKYAHLKFLFGIHIEE